METALVETAIEVRELSKSFGDKKVLEGVNISVPRSAVYGFLGNNGAGKSTLIRTLLGLIKPDQGQIRINSELLKINQVSYKKFIGCLVDSACLYLQLTPKEYLNISCKIKSLKSSAIQQALAVVDMLPDLNTPMDKFSLGMKQRIALANALLGDPKLLILDEPTNALDPAGMQEIRVLIKSLPERTGATVFLSSHLLDEIQKTATHVGILHQGKMMLESSLDDLIKTQSSSLELVTSDSVKLNDYFQNKNISSDIVSAECVRVNQVKPNQCSQLNRQIIEAGFELIESRFNQGTLENIFLNLVEKKQTESQTC